MIPSPLRIVLALGLALTLPLGAARAADLPSDNGLFYYQIGGGSPLAYAPNNATTVVSVGASATWDTNFACGANFDPQLAVSNQLNGITEGFKQYMGNVINSAKGAVASLPAMMIQRANPALYDLLTQGVLQSKYDIEFAQTSCEDMQKAMARDGFDFEKMVTISKSDDMRQQQATRDQDIIQVSRTVDAARGDNGITWFGGAQRGGQYEPPMRMTADTVIAGYNILMNRAVTDTSSVGAGGAGKPLAENWSSPVAAANWAVDVLGDKEVRTCDKCQKVVGTPGKGLVAKFEEEKHAVEPSLAALLSRSTPPTAAELEAISVPPTLMITRDVIDALKQEPDAPLIAGNLAGEIALARTMERALHLRRMLEAGKREAHVADVEPAQNHMQENLDTLNRDMENLLFELQVRDRIASSTPQKLLARAAARKQADPAGAKAAPRVIEGAVKTGP